jgi:ankyrin repeat protein
MPTLSLPSSPNLAQLKRQAKELLRRQPNVGRLRDAQRIIAEQYGFDSWDALRAQVESMRGIVRGPLQPDELKNPAGQSIWSTIDAAAKGDAATLRRLIAGDPLLARAQYWYTQPIHFAVRSGHEEAVRVLLDAGADPEYNAYYSGSLIDMARERGHERIAQMLEESRERMGRVAPRDDHPIHRVAESDDVRLLAQLLDADPSLLERGDRSGGSPLHRAVMRSARKAVALLLDRGANIHAAHSTSSGGGGGWWTNAVQAIDLAIWGHNNLAPHRGDLTTAQLLLSRGAECDLTVASAVGDIDRVRAILDDDPAAIRRMRGSGRRPLTAAVEFGHLAIVKLLLERGADPNWPESGAERGAALRLAVGDEINREFVELLLAHGADPNSGVDSGGTATWAAIPAFRPLLIARGGRLSAEDLIGAEDDDAVMRRVAQEPGVCGAIFTTVVSHGKRDLLRRLLDAGIRAPAVLTGCQGYLLDHTDMLRTLLERGMCADLMNWQHQTLLHLVCGRGPDAGDRAIEQAGVLLDAGADISARDDEFSSTPLAWATRSNALQMVEFLLARGAPTNLPDDPPWATPLAWAERRRHAQIVAVLRRHGAR